MQLQRLTHLASEEIQADYRALIENIKGYMLILNSSKRMNEVIREELLEVKEEFTDKRRSDFVFDCGNVDKSSLIPRRDVVVTLSSRGYIKYQDLSIYASQGRGGMGKKTGKIKDEDYITKTVVANSHDVLLCFTSLGNVFAANVYDLPAAETRTSAGQPVQQFFAIKDGEKISALLPISEFDDSHYIFVATAQGMVKKTALKSFKGLIKRLNQHSVSYIVMAEGDEVINACVTSGDDDIVLVSSEGRAIRFCEFYKGSVPAIEDEDELTDGSEAAEEADDSADSPDADEGDDEAGAVLNRHAGCGIRPSGRKSGGVKGMRLGSSGRVVAMFSVPADKTATPMLLATAEGIGKRILVSDVVFRTNRGGQGVRVITVNAKTGGVIGACTAEDGSEYLLVTDKGFLVRSPVDSVRIFGRYSAGVVLMRVADNGKVIGLQSISADVAAKANEAAAGRAQDRRDEQLRAELISSSGSAAEADETAAQSETWDESGSDKACREA